MPLITNALVTAYCACQICCGPEASGITAIGRAPVAGITVAGPRAFPLGTSVQILGKTYKLEDRTAPRFDGRWDIYFHSHDDAKQFGTRRATVIVRAPTVGKKKGKKK